MVKTTPSSAVMEVTKHMGSEGSVDLLKIWIQSAKVGLFVLLIVGLPVAFVVGIVVAFSLGMVLAWWLGIIVAVVLFSIKHGAVWTDAALWVNCLAWKVNGRQVIVVVLIGIGWFIVAVILLVPQIPCITVVGEGRLEMTAGSELETTIFLNVTVENPNSWEIHIDRFLVELSYQGDTVGSGEVNELDISRWDTSWFSTEVTIVTGEGSAGAVTKYSVDCSLTAANGVTMDVSFLVELSVFAQWTIEIGPLPVEVPCVAVDSGVYSTDRFAAASGDYCDNVSQNSANTAGSGTLDSSILSLSRTESDINNDGDDGGSHRRLVQSYVAPLPPPPPAVVPPVHVRRRRDGRRGATVKKS